MLKCKITFLVFQSGKLNEVLETEQDFTNAQEMMQAFIKFTARECAMRTNSQVRLLYRGSGPDLNLPSLQNGCGPETNIVIKDAVLI